MRPLHRPFPLAVAMIFACLHTVTAPPTAAGTPWGLDEPEQPDRSAARHAISALGGATTGVAGSLARHPDPRVRREAALVLAPYGAAHADLVELALDPDPGVADAGITALLRHPEQALADVDRALAVPDIDPARALSLHLVAERLIPAWIESVFGRAYTKAGNGSMWKGQFAPLVARAGPCAVALIGIIESNENLAVNRATSATRHFTTRLTALRALAEIAGNLSAEGRARVARLLRAVHDSPDNYNPRSLYNRDAIQGAARVALYLQGDSAPIEAHLERQRWTIKSYETRAVAAMFINRARLELAFDLHVIGRYSNAIAEYQKVLAADPAQSNLLYNLACSYALNAQEERAVDAMVRAIEAGHDDHEQFLVDGELARARAHASFAARVLAHPRWKGPR